MGGEYSSCRCNGDGALPLETHQSLAFETSEVAVDLTDSPPKTPDLVAPRVSKEVVPSSDASTSVGEPAGVCPQSHSEEAPEACPVDSDDDDSTTAGSESGQSADGTKRISRTTSSVPSKWLHKIIEKTGEIESVYDFNGILGEGSFGKVRKAVCRSSGAVRAVKSIPKKAAQADKIKSEIEITKMVDHPHVIKLYEIFENDEVINLVLQCCLGGNLDQLVDYRKQCTEQQAAEIMQQVLEGVQYMHKCCICHRDLKPDNVLVKATDPLNLKITDFGLSCVFERGKIMTKEIVGTARTMAPEVIRGKYTHLCDVWSCGVIMYYVLCGYFPFMADTSEEVLKKVAKGVYAFETVEWVDVSEATMDFIGLMMNKNQRARYTAQQALKHDWFKMHKPKPKALEEIYAFSILK